MEQNDDLRVFTEAISKAREIALKYGQRLEFFDEEKIIRAINLMNTYGFYEVKQHVGGMFKLRIVSKNYRLTNTTVVDKSIPEPDYYMLLESGNIGAYAICRDQDYIWVSVTVYEPLREKLNALSYKYDPLNDYWLFVPSQSTAQRIEELISEAKDEVEKHSKAHKREKLLDELAALDGE